jgi:hypothetical protein
MWPDYPDTEVKSFDEWCMLVWDLFVFKEDFLKYVQESYDVDIPNPKFQFWAFKLAWANYQRDVIMPRLRERQTEDD